MDAPACPSWCRTTHTEGPDRRCVMPVSLAIDDDCDAVTVTLERFAYIDDGEWVVEAPMVRIDALGRMTTVAALGVAEALIFAAGRATAAITAAA